MSLLGPLRASSSRLPLSTIAGSGGIHTTAYRAATAAQQKEAKKPGWTVQDVDEQLGKMQKQQEQMKKSGQHFDFYSINVPVLERIAEPPASPSWVFKTGGWKWLKERATRYRQDRQFLNEMIKRNAFPKRKGATFATSIYHSIMCLRPSYKAGALVEDLTQVWERYNAAQARGDEFALRETSTGTALSTARSLARSKLRMTWSLVSHHTEPKVLSARLAPIDLDGKIEIAQVALRFDATQVLEISKGAQKSRKEQRSVENWVFERHLPARTGWRVKERLDTTTPSVQL